MRRPTDPPRAPLEPPPLEMYTVYHCPLDFPGHYVVRRFTVSQGRPIADLTPLIVTTSLQDARRAIPRGLTHFPRAPTDDPAILETWL